MKAGRELDALVAEKIFGGPEKNVQWYWWHGSTPSLDIDPPLYAGPSFSSDITDAWQVVKRIRSQGFFACVEGDRDGDWEVTFEKGHPEKQGYQCGVDVDGNVCSAICLAALKALGVEDEN